MTCPPDYHPDYHFIYRRADDVHPPHKLIDHWTQFYKTAKEKPDWWVIRHVALRAAEWGADQELDMCATYLDSSPAKKTAEDLVVARRTPRKQGSLKKQALESLKAICAARDVPLDPTDLFTLRDALEALPNE